MNTLLPSKTHYTGPASPFKFLALPPPEKKPLIKISEEDRSHIMLTINQLRNLALTAQQQGVISRYTHSNLIEDISQSINMLSRTVGTAS